MQDATPPAETVLLSPAHYRLNALADQPTFMEGKQETFPSDYSDTYALGVEDGKKLLARELLTVSPGAAISLLDTLQPVVRSAHAMHADKTQLSFACGESTYRVTVRRTSKPTPESDTAGDTKQGSAA